MIIQSMGFGVQSATISVMACLGDLPMPTLAIFADPGWEGESTYAYAKTFTLWALERGLKIITVSGGNIRAEALDAKKRWASMPLWTYGDPIYDMTIPVPCPINGEPNTHHAPHPEAKIVGYKPSMLRRQCMREYKVSVVARAIRAFMGLRPRQRVKEPVTLWLGISLDEVVRMKESRIGWLKNDWPLIAKRMDRADCIRYLKKHDIPVPPKSACVGCPYRSDASWAEMRKERPVEFADAVAFDATIRRTRVADRNPVFLHRSLKPLDQVNFKKREPDMFAEECEGHCGL